jgi:RNA polymerase sigma factor (sigma-70 family)
MKKVVELAIEAVEIHQPRPVHILQGKNRRPEIDNEIAQLFKLSDKSVQLKLQGCLDTGTKINGETLICLLRALAGQKDRKLFNLTFKVLATQCTPTLIHHVSRLTPDEQKEHAHDVLTKIVATLGEKPRDLDYAEVHFNHYLKLRSVDEYRKKVKTFEKRNTQENPSLKNDEGDEDGHGAVENIADERRTPEEYAAATAALKKLPEELRMVYMLYHFRDMEQKDIAAQIGKTVRTVYNLLKQAQELIN